MMKKVALALVVVAVLAMSVAGVMAASQFADTQEWSIYTASSCYVLSYNYETANLVWSGEFLTAGQYTYTKPAVNQWMGFWTYDTNAATYTEVVYVMTETY